MPGVAQHPPVLGPVPCCHGQGRLAECLLHPRNPWAAQVGHKLAPVTSHWEGSAGAQAATCALQLISGALWQWGSAYQVGLVPPARPPATEAVSGSTPGSSSHSCRCVSSWALFPQHPAPGSVTLCNLLGAGTCPVCGEGRTGQWPAQRPTWLPAEEVTRLLLGHSPPASWDWCLGWNLRFSSSAGTTGREGSGPRMEQAGCRTGSRGTCVLPCLVSALLAGA